MNHTNCATDHVSNTEPCLELLTTTADWQIREDRSFYVPDLLSDKDDDFDLQTYAAAKEHAAHLHNAERLVCQAEDLVGLMRAAIGDESDARAMQADTALTVIEKKLRRAHSQINKHDRCHANLFLAYFDLKNEAGHGVE